MFSSFKKAWQAAAAAPLLSLVGAGGADAAYINEEKFGIKELTRDMNTLISKMDKGHVYRGLLIVNEKANSNYNIDFIQR